MGNIERDLRELADAIAENLGDDDSVSWPEELHAAAGQVGRLEAQLRGAVISAYEQGFLDGAEAARVAATHAVMPEDFIERALDQLGGQSQ